MRDGGEGPARFAFWSGLALTVLGVVSLLGGTYFYLIVLGGVGAISAVTGRIALARIRRSGQAGWLGRHVGLLSLALLAAVSILSAYVIGVEHEVVYEMTWDVGASAPARSGEEHVTLRFTRYPGYYIEMHSDALVAYLESRPTRGTEVTFVVTTDFGHMRGFRPVRVGDLPVDPSWAGAYGATGDARLSPFHVWE